MRRKRLIRPYMCNPPGRIKRGKRCIRQLHRATGGCGVNALSALHVRSVGRIRRDKRRIRHLHRATGGCGVDALSALHVRNSVTWIKRDKRRIRHFNGRIILNPITNPTLPFSFSPATAKLELIRPHNNYFTYWTILRATRRCSPRWI